MVASSCVFLMLTWSDSLAFGARWNSTLGTVEPPLTASSLQRPLVLVPEGKNPYIGSLQRPLYSVPKVTVVEKFNCIKICCFDCIRSHGHCLLQEYSHEYDMLLVNRTQSLFGVVPGSGLRSTFVTLFTQQTLWYLIPESCSLLVRTYVPSFTRSRSFPEFSIAVRKDWVIEGLETVKGLSRETHCPSQKSTLINSDVLDLVSCSGISSGATFETFCLV